MGDDEKNNIEKQTTVESMEYYAGILRKADAVEIPNFDPFQKNAKGETIIFGLAKCGYVDSVEYLVSKHNIIDKDYVSYAKLINAAGKKGEWSGWRSKVDDEVFSKIEYLFSDQGGFDLNYIFENGYTITGMALKSMANQIANKLMDMQGSTFVSEEIKPRDHPLVRAVAVVDDSSDEDTGIIQKALNNNAVDNNVINEVFLKCCELGKLKVIDILKSTGKLDLNYQTDIERYDSEQKKSVSTGAKGDSGLISASRYKQLGVVDKLLAFKEINVNLQNDNLDTALTLTLSMIEPRKEGGFIMYPSVNVVMIASRLLQYEHSDVTLENVEKQSAESLLNNYLKTIMNKDAIPTNLVDKLNLVEYKNTIENQINILSELTQDASDKDVLFRAINKIVMSKFQKVGKDIGLNDIINKRHKSAGISKYYDRMSEDDFIAELYKEMGDDCPVVLQQNRNKLAKISSIIIDNKEILKEPAESKEGKGQLLCTAKKVTPEDFKGLVARHELDLELAKGAKTEGPAKTENLVTKLISGLKKVWQGLFENKDSVKVNKNVKNS